MMLASSGISSARNPSGNRHRRGARGVRGQASPPRPAPARRTASAPGAGVGRMIAVSSSVSRLGLVRMSSGVSSFPMSCRMAARPRWRSRGAASRARCPARTTSSATRTTWSRVSRSLVFRSGTNRCTIGERPNHSATRFRPGAVAALVLGGSLGGHHARRGNGTTPWARSASVTGGVSSGEANATHRGQGVSSPWRWAASRPARLAA